MDGIKQKINEILEVNKWQSYVAGKVDGALAVLDVLNIGKERRIEVLAEALGLSRETATDFVDEFYQSTNE